MIDYILSVFQCDYVAIHNAGLLLRLHLSFRMLIVRRACRHDIARASMLLCNKCFLIDCRSDAVVDTLFVVCRAIFSIFGISRQTDIHICDCSCKVIEFFEFFWTAVDFDLRFPAHLRVFVRRHMQTYTKCVRLRFARTHLSRSEVLACLQLSYCFATIHR